MTPWLTKITKSEDVTGHFVLDPASPLKPGVEIEVDLDSRGIMSFTISKTGKKFTSEVVEVIDPAGRTPKLLFPVDMLDL
jgi:hypothetical protein